MLCTECDQHLQMHTPTNQQLSFDAAGWLTAWQNTPTAPTSSASYLYDNAGNRVVQPVTSGSTTTTTTTYYYASGARIATAVNGVLSYLGDDVLGSVNVALDASGAIQASQLYAPYGGGRYSSETMPGSFGYTGQRADAATGLDYYVARYYDPVAGQFISADTVLGTNGADPFELSRYAYVEGNPESRTDPTGHCPWCIAAMVWAFVGGAISAGSQVVSNMQKGQSFGDAIKQVDLVEVGKAAAGRRQLRDERRHLVLT